MNETNIPNEICIEVGELNQCMGGELLLAAVAIECLLYVALFVGGFKLVEHIKIITNLIKIEYKPVIKRINLKLVNGLKHIRKL